MEANQQQLDELSGKVVKYRFRRVKETEKAILIVVRFDNLFGSTTKNVWVPKSTIVEIVCEGSKTKEYLAGWLYKQITKEYGYGLSLVSFEYEALDPNNNVLFITNM